MTHNNNESRAIMIERSIYSPDVETNLTKVTMKREEEDRDQGIFNLQPILQRFIKVRSQLGKEFLAELFGSFLLLLIGLSSVAQAKFLGTGTGLLSINLAFGFAVVVAILVTGKTSGCHINPAVSFAMLLTGRMTLLRFIVYVIAQFIGSFLGAAAMYVVYLDSFEKFANQSNRLQSIETAGVFF